MIIMLTRSLIFAVVMTLAGCLEIGPVPDPHDNPYGATPMSDLFKGLPGGSFGNTIVSLPPSQVVGIAPVGWGEIKTVVKFPGHMRKGNMAHEQDPAVISASISAQPNPDSTFQGPITGIALWGSGGGAIQTAEFDIPVNTSLDPDFAVADPTPFDTPRGGTFISVIGTSLEIRAHNDALLLPAGPDGKGTGQLTIGGWAQDSPQFQPVFVTASIGKGTRPSTNTSATKTVWAFNAGGVGAQSLGPGGDVHVRIPPFAKAFRIARSRAGAGVVGNAPSIAFKILNVGVSNQGDGPYQVAAGVAAPVINLSGQETTIDIANTEAANSIDSIYVIFYLAL